MYDEAINSTDGFVHSAGVKRPDAVKFSPYNLTVTQGGTFNADIGIKGGGFTQYPTQTGAYFHWAGLVAPRFAWDPFTPGAVTGWNNLNVTGFWNAYMATHETCPEGYRRPNDGSISAANTIGAVAGSEFRQSLWLNPPTGLDGIVGDISNNVTGYYADGFFDRRQIVGAPGNYDPGSNSSVSVANAGIAHRGYLFFNPNNNASLFFPSAGVRSTSYSGGPLQNPGSAALYISSSAWSTSSEIGTIMSPQVVTLTLTARGNARTIRCVYDPPPPLTVSLTSVPISGSTMLTGETLYLTAVPAPSGITIDEYEWQYYDGSIWITIATTSTPTYNATINANGSNQFRVIARNAVSAATSNIITITGITPLGGSAARITWEEATERYVLTTDPRDAGLYFRFSSVIGIFSGAGRHTQDLSLGTNTSSFNAANHVTINFTTVIINIAGNIPYTTAVPVTLDAAFHNAANVKAGLGDPCRLVGLDLNNIKNKTAAQLTQAEIDNGLWRLPAVAEHQQFSGYTTTQNGNPGVWWWAQGQNPTGFTLGVAGGEFPARNHVNGGPGKFLPAVGDRDSNGTANRQRTRGFFLTNTATTTNYEGFVFSSSEVRNAFAVRDYMWPARCIPQ